MNNKIKNVTIIILAIIAPRSITVDREEVYLRKQKEK